MDYLCSMGFTYVYSFPLPAIFLCLTLIYWGKIIDLFFETPVKRWFNITVMQSGSSNNFYFLEFCWNLFNVYTKEQIFMGVSMD